MTGKNINLDDKMIDKSNFYKSKKLFNIYGTDVSRILVSKKEPYGQKSSFKLFIGYDDVIRPFCIKLHQMIGYVKCFNSKQTMSFQVNDNNLLNKDTNIWKEISSLMNIVFDSQPVYGKLFMVIMINI